MKPKPKEGDARHLREDVYDGLRRVTPAGSKIVAKAGPPVTAFCPATGMGINVPPAVWDKLPRRGPAWVKFEVADSPSVATVAELEWLASDDPLSEKALSRMTRGKGGAAAKVLVASLKGKPAGHLVYTPDRSWTTVDRLLVQPAFRRKGCARALVNALRVRESSRRGWYRCWVADDNSLLDAHKALAALGFVSAVDEGMIRFGFREAPDLELRAGAEEDLKLARKKKERSS